MLRTRRLLIGSIAVLLGTGLLVACGDSTDTDGTAEPTTAPTTEPTGTSSFVYFLVDTRTGFRLAREEHALSGTDPAKEAVEAMIAGPVDPDYSTTWNPDTRVLSVHRDASTILVDLSADARTANAGSEVAARMVQELVYTVTEASDRDAKVQLLIEGKPADELWGALSWDRPIGREPARDVRCLVQIDSPTEGQTVSSPVTVAGDAAAFEANVPWRVLKPSGAVVRQGATMTTQGMRFAPYSFTVRLKPGHYVVEVSEDDPSGGEGGTPMTDTRSIVVE